MHEVPFLHRLSTRLTLLILVVVAVLAGATIILLVRGFSLAGQGLLLGVEGGLPQEELNAIVRGTVINLIAIFMFTLVAATVFSRGLLVEPIASLVKGTQELAQGNLGVTLPVTSASELGVLARAFNAMSLSLAERTRELTESNEALRVSEERYGLAMRGANDGLWDWDIASDTMYYSPRWKEMLGYGEDEVKPTPRAWLELTHPDEREGLQAQLSAHLRGSSPSFSVEHRLRHKDGSWRWVLARGASLRDGPGRAVRLAGSITDITERVEALTLLERRVQERTAELSALLELSNSIALTLELHPMLDSILDKLHETLGNPGAAVLEPGGPDGPTVLARRGAVRIEPAVLAPRLEAAVGPFILPAEGLLAIPLVVRDNRVGLLLLAHPPGEPFTQERTRLASAFANQVAVALENAKLYDRVHEQAALEERQHLARELHDSVSQALYGILLGTHAAQKKLEGDPAAASSALEYVENLAQAGIAEMRALIFELRPESLEKEGLTGALRRQLDALETRHSLDTSYSHDGEPELPLATKQVLFRIAQEALHNVVKHARAEHVELRLTMTGDHVGLVIVDDGVGFDPSGAFPGHLGLRSMRERVRGLGGSFGIDSTLGIGTTVRAEVPVMVGGRAGEAT